MRFQALMPDILHWLGITKIDRMLSMSKWVSLLCPGVPMISVSLTLILHSSMKHDAIVGQG